MTSRTTRRRDAGLIAITAGAGLIGFAAFLADVIRGKAVAGEGWAGFFGVTGLLLLVLGLHTTVTWPYGGDGFEYANIAFGQPAAGFGALLLFAAVYLWRHRSLFTGDAASVNTTTLANLKPSGIVVGALGLGMAVLAIAFIRFQLGAAPPQEPITGRFGHLPILEALFLGGLWGIIAIGALIFSFALLTDRIHLLLPGCNGRGRGCPRPKPGTPRPCSGSVKRSRSQPLPSRARMVFCSRALRGP